MKNLPLVITFLMAVIYVVGCHREPATDLQMEPVQPETNTVMQAVPDDNFVPQAEFAKARQTAERPSL